MAARKKTTEPKAEPEIEITIDAEPADTESYTRLVSPTGHETTVPDSIRDALLESGYTEA